MKTYQNEINDGISNQLQASASIKFESILKVPKAYDKKDIFKTCANQDLLDNIGAQHDLALINAILVSTGWNGNTDIFMPAETWAARHSPANKQVNLNHSDQIVGHMISSIVTDYDGNLIPDDTEEIPSEFDIVVAAVLYTRHPNEQLRKSVAELLPKIANGDARVSMECFFTDFDYGLIDANGSKLVLPRNEETSWITKHMRQFGGCGSINLEHGTYALGRVIKNMTFSGNGIVDEPANERSIIFTEMQSFSGTTVRDDADFSIDVEAKNNEEDKNMSKDENTVSQEKYDALAGQLEKFKTEAAENLKKEIDGYKTTVANLGEEVKTKDDEIADLTKASEEKDETIESLKAELKEKTEAHAEVTEKLEEMKAENVKAERVNKLISVGKTEEEAVAVVEEWAGASDDQFKSIVAIHKDLIDAKADKGSETPDNEDEDEVDDAQASLNVDKTDDKPAPVVGDDANASEEEEFDDAVAYLKTIMFDSGK